MKNEHQSEIESGRNFLKANWDKIENIETDQEKRLPFPDLQKRCPEGAELIDLVSPEKLTIGKMFLIDAIKNRKSRREYTKWSLTLEELSFLLYATQGVRKSAKKYSFRTVPSGGARHSFETYLFISRVDGLKRGLYRFLPFDNKLCVLSLDDNMEYRVNVALSEQNWKSAVTFMWTTIPYRMEWRYSIISHKIIAIDAGHLCQNLYLACESIGCGTCAIGTYDQDKMDKLLNVDGKDEFAIYAAPVGKL